MSQTQAESRFVWSDTPSGRRNRAEEIEHGADDQHEFSLCVLAGEWRRLAEPDEKDLFRLFVYRKSDGLWRFLGAFNDKADAIDRARNFQDT